MNIIEEYAACLKLEHELWPKKRKIDTAIYKFLCTKFGLWDANIETAKQIGKFYGGIDHVNGEYGFYWHYINNFTQIKIQYNTVKNQWLDIDEDNEMTVTFEEIEKYLEN